VAVGKLLADLGGRQQPGLVIGKVTLGAEGPDHDALGGLSHTRTGDGVAPLME
jgi:hypothetical protein